jgi:hypothetical protein
LDCAGSQHVNAIMSGNKAARLESRILESITVVAPLLRCNRRVSLKATFNVDARYS